MNLPSYMDPPDLKQVGVLSLKGAELLLSLSICDTGVRSNSLKKWKINTSAIILGQSSPNFVLLGRERRPPPLSTPLCFPVLSGKDRMRKKSCDSEIRYVGTLTTLHRLPKSIPIVSSPLSRAARAASSNIAITFRGTQTGR